MSDKTGPSFGLLKGIGLLMRGEERGFFCFGSNRVAFLFSLAPLMSLLPVQASLSTTDDAPHRIMASVLTGFCMLLLPPVISHAAAQYWRREELWLRYAIAFNWCRWAFFLIVAISMLIVSSLFGVKAAEIILPVFGLYDLWLQWFLVRRGMLLSRGVATLTVALIITSALALAGVDYALGKL